jgi:hypothetical protein
MVLHRKKLLMENNHIVLCDVLHPSQCILYLEAYASGKKSRKLCIMNVLVHMQNEMHMWHLKFTELQISIAMTSEMNKSKLLFKI